MAANPTIYCLEEITDYSEFERLCSDLMSREGYSSIEPLGGFKDKGRDAIHVNKENSKATVFAYSVREDWRAKLSEDAKKIRDHGHPCQQLVFVTTARFTPSERDEAINTIKNDSGWSLELYGLERLRVLLDTSHPDIKRLHPQIFPSPFLNVDESGKSVQDHLFISFAPEDKALATWLTQKLTAEGYAVWCESFLLLGGENYPKDVDLAIKEQTFRFLALYSRASINNAEVTRQRAVASSASSIDDFLIPLNVDGIKSGELDRKTGQLQFINFENWADGLDQLLNKLEKVACPKQLGNGKTIAAETFLQKNFLSDAPETLITNFLQFKKIPSTILHFQTDANIEGRQVGRLGAIWAFKFIRPGTFLSFQTPPQEVMDELRLEKIDEYAWSDADTINGIPKRILISELLRRSLETKCYEKGLKYHREGRRSWIYFPSGLVPKDHIKYVRPDGKKSHVNVMGKRTYWRPGKSEEYLYHLAPDFYIRQDVFEGLSVAVRIKLYITDSRGYLLPPRTSLSRRKRLCRDWWNNEWLNRVLAICQYLGEDGSIVMGTNENEQIILDANPILINAPIGINELVLGNAATEERNELLDTLEDDTEEVPENTYV